MALGSAPNPGMVGDDAQRAIEDNPLHADDGISEERAAIAVDDLDEDEQAAGDPVARPRSWLDRLLGRA